MSETVIMLSLARLRESPFNPRRHYNEASLAELADTMRPPLGRVHQPIVVRPLVQLDVEHDHEIVFGHRRFRAAAIAGLDEIPAIVRAMSDDEARVAQVVENLQREDVSPLEEADALQTLRHEHGRSIETLMQYAGKSRSYVFNRLRLATAHDKVRESVADGRMGAEVAQEVARLPHPLQPEALKAMFVKEWRDGEYVECCVSYRKAKQVLADRFQLELDDAPFDLRDGHLVPAAGACHSCHKNTSNDPTLAKEWGAGVCTDIKCFESKKVAHLQVELKAAKKRGHRVVQGEEAKELLPFAWKRTPDGHVSVYAAITMAGGGMKQLREILEELGPKAPKLTIIANPHSPGEVVECITEEQYRQVEEAIGLQPDSDDAEDDRQPETPRPPEEQACLSNWDAIKEAIMRRVLVTPRTTDELRMFLEREMDIGDYTLGLPEKVIGWNSEELDKADDAFSARCEKLKELTADQLGALLVMVVIDSYTSGYLRGTPEWLTARLELAARYGVDVLNPDGAPPPAEPEPPPSTAARAPKKAKGKAKTSEAAPANGELAVDGEPAGLAPVAAWPFPKRPEEASPTKPADAGDAVKDEGAEAEA
jgi:ParB/RepB/Spo0J family partition protein